MSYLDLPFGEGEPEDLEIPLAPEKVEIILWISIEMDGSRHIVHCYQNLEQAFYCLDESNLIWMPVPRFDSWDNQTHEDYIGVNEAGDSVTLTPIKISANHFDCENEFPNGIPLPVAELAIAALQGDPIAVDAIKDVIKM